MNIRVDLNIPINDGKEVVFRSPVDCSQVTGLIVYYPENGNTVSKEFAFADAHGNNVGDIDHLFAEDVVVKVILDVTKSMAFVQNADTNAYLEGRFAGIETTIDKLCPSFTETGAAVTCEPVEGYPLTVIAEEGANIIRYGKNIVNLDAMLNSNLTKDENGIYHISKSVSSVWHFPIPIPANTPVTFTFLDLKGQSPGRNALISLSQAFADGTQGTGMWFGTSEAFPNKATLRYNSEYLRFAIVAYGGSEDYWCEFSGLQVEIGETPTAYEPYREGEAIQAGQQIAALPGVNTFLADSGVITVSGKANPAAEIEKLKNAILAMGANV